MSKYGRSRVGPTDPRKDTVGEGGSCEECIAGNDDRTRSVRDIVATSLPGVTSMVSPLVCVGAPEDKDVGDLVVGDKLLALLG